MARWRSDSGFSVADDVEGIRGYKVLAGAGASPAGSAVDAGVIIDAGVSRSVVRV